MIRKAQFNWERSLIKMPPNLWRILRYEQIIDKVSLKSHKALSKTFFLDTVNFFYSPSDENAYSPC